MVPLNININSDLPCIGVVLVLSNITYVQGNAAILHVLGSTVGIEFSMHKGWELGIA